MSERVFTLDEANAALDDLRTRLERIRLARQTLIATAERIEDRVAADGGGVEGSAWFSAQAELKALVEGLSGDGVILRDPEAGLIDFPSERDGEPIFLCWKADEPTVAYWHGRDSGFSSRQPV